MVGLSIVLEKGSNSNNNPQVINKATMIKPSPSLPPPPPAQPSHHQPSSWRNSPPSTAALPAASFLDQCFLCHQKLLPGKDIYMYKGDRAFCSVECRCRQIFMDEEESTTTTSTMYKRPNCSFSAMKAPQPSSSSSPSRNRKGTRNRANGFAY